MVEKKHTAMNFKNNLQHGPTRMWVLFFIEQIYAKIEKNN